MGLRPSPQMLDFEAARHHGQLLRGPTHVALDITNQCNMRCKHCFNLSGTLDREEMSDTEILSLIDEICEMQPRSFCYCGGEPLLRYELILEATRRLANRHILVSMVSNGYLMTPEKAKALREAGVIQIQTSIDGATPTEHERLRNVKGSWERACQTVRVLTEAGFPIRPITCTPTRFNAHQVDEMIQLAISLGATELRMQPLMLLGRAVVHREELLPSDEQYREIARKLLEKQGRVPIKLEWGDPVDHIIRFSHLLPDICPFLDIRSDGYLGISAYLPLTVGSLRRHSLKEYWDAGMPQVWRTPLAQRLSTYIRCMDDFYRPDGYLPVVFYEQHLHVDLIDDDLHHMPSSEVDRLVMDVQRREPWFHESQGSGGRRMPSAVLATPKFLWEAVGYAREERNGHLTVTARQDPALGDFVMNPTARRLAELCNGTRSLSQLYGAFAAEYEDASSETVKEDVDQVLHDFDGLGLIEWVEGSNPLAVRVPTETMTDPQSGLAAILASERDIRAISDYLADALTLTDGAKLVWTSPVSFIPDNYTELLIRNSLFNYLELYCLIQHEGKTAGICVVTGSHLRSGARSATIPLVAVNKGIDREAAGRLFGRAIALVNKYVVSANVKARAYLLQDQWKIKDIRDLFTAMGLAEEHLLTNELGGGRDVMMLVRYVSGT